MGNSESGIVDKLPPNFPNDIKFYHFHNLCNTCYCNSVIQLLLASNYVSCFFKNLFLVTKEGKALVVQEILQSPLFQLLQIYQNSVDDSNKEREFFIKPIKFLDSIYRETDQFTKGQQHDAHEFIIYLISSFDEVIKKFNDIHGKTLTPPFSKLFEGVKATCFHCELCENDKERQEPFISLDLGILPQSNLQNLVDESLFPEIVEEDWKCDNCSQKSEAQITSYMAQLPPVLLIELQRFKYNRQTQRMEKNSEIVKIPNEIHINSGSGPQNYKLKAIICHIGISLFHGHFIAFSKVDEKWLLANDDNLNVLDQITFEQLLEGRNVKYQYVPYLLMYEC
ncbi:Clan CA, family C19, ubiquitin hydrolase-like cysteine peptidase [Tritrichomonas foetus]|uniref:ubiquitinyl hydrolase 1 n=1 Tax=Tritrichomonas foetus TaxID=1144522 RepID=A0A1J4JLV7_9EUKA|nr:Clan CA, family C19, ubiquitin hydrolase-like cysteine peptidase [Tritrichomonas foetus]|eukprot:OHT00067.1 Clan CA, family C19, ubiquitin hydrolase-like cysteine peptidase [Tritrichomonas foetus]